MVDVAVTVMMDGKQIYAHAGAGAPDGFAFAAAALQSAADHFKNVVAVTNKPIGFSAGQAPAQNRSEFAQKKLIDSGLIKMHPELRGRISHG